MQNNIVRYILNAPPRAHVGAQEFKQVGLLPVAQRVNQLKLNHMYDIVNRTAPGYLLCHIEMVDQKHGHYTRASVMSCSVPRVKGTARNTFFTQG